MFSVNYACVQEHFVVCYGTLSNTPTQRPIRYALRSQFASRGHANEIQTIATINGTFTWQEQLL